VDYKIKTMPELKEISRKDLSDLLRYDKMEIDLYETSPRLKGSRVDYIATLKQRVKIVSDVLENPDLHLIKLT